MIREARPRPLAYVALVSLLLLAILASPSTAGAQAATESWSGAIDLSPLGGGSLDFSVTFTTAPEGELSATVSIPAQGAVDIPLSDVVNDGARMHFVLVTSPSSAVFDAVIDGDSAKGTLRQGGAEMPIELRRLGADEKAGPPRPQTPEPPFPYASHDVAYDNAADGTRLAGTLTVPEGTGPHPAAILITGSGAQDRDETIFQHKPFLVIADDLTRQGIAVLRVDDRGVGGSSGNIAQSTSADFAGDVAAGMDFLATRDEIDAGRIGLVGHSEGGLIAPMVAAARPDVAYIVLLAGPGLPGRDLMPTQLADVQRAVGRPEDNIARQLEAQARLMDAAIADDEAAVRQAAADLVDTQLETVPESDRQQVRERGIETAVAQMSTDWYRAFLVTDPRTALRSVDCPVLALNGSLDLQVAAEPNLIAIEAALREAGNDDVTTQTLPNLNHLFQSAVTGSVAEYGAITETFAPAALQVMREWIRARVGLQ